MNLNHKNMSNVTCKDCGVVQDKEVLRKINATKNMFFMGKVHKFFICQNCGKENEED